jgi:hypothetical protein
MSCTINQNNHALTALHAIFKRDRRRSRGQNLACVLIQRMSKWYASKLMFYLSLLHLSNKFYDLLNRRILIRGGSKACFINE